MTNPYGDGRWNTGSRPIQTGPAQSAYDQGVQQRQQQERIQREQAAQRARDAQKQQEQYQKDYGPDARKNRGADTAHAGHESEDGGGGLEGWLALAGIGGFVVLVVVIWNAILGMLPATTGGLATALNYSPWAAGVVAAGIGLRISRFLMRIAGWVLGAAVLFFGSAVAYGVYQGMSGEG